MGLSVYFSREVGCPMLRDEGEVEGLGFDKKEEYLVFVMENRATL